MAGRQCYHCKQWIEEGEAHDCWTTTEAALTQDLSEDLRDAWERLREAAESLGDQRIYASHKSIMFSRRSCYFFVRPKKSFLELCVFLGRAAERATGSARRSHLEVQSGSPHSDQAPGRGRGPDYRLAPGSLRAVGDAGEQTGAEARQGEAETTTRHQTEGQSCPEETRLLHQIKKAVAPEQSARGKLQHHGGQACRGLQQPEVHCRRSIAWLKGRLQNRLHA